MSMSLTPQQLRIFRLIRDSRNTQGYSPTMQEIADTLGISKVTVFEHVQALVDKGALVRQPNKARSLAIAEEATLPDETAKSGELPLVGRIAAGHPVEKYEQQETLQLESIFGPRRGQQRQHQAVLPHTELQRRDRTCQGPPCRAAGRPQDDRHLRGAGL